MAWQFVAVGISLLVISIPATAEDRRRIIWNDLRLGMSKSEVKALHPGKRVALSSNCDANLKTIFTGESLSGVVLFVDSSSYCSVIISKSMIEKYGVPDDIKRNRYPESPLMKALESDEFSWNKENIKTTLIVKTALPGTVVSYEWKPATVPESAASNL